jgi:hypothetical protein
VTAKAQQKENIDKSDFLSIQNSVHQKTLSQLKVNIAGLGKNKPTLFSYALCTQNL